MMAERREPDIAAADEYLLVIFETMFELLDQPKCHSIKKYKQKI